MKPEEWEYYRSRQMAIMNYNIGMSNAEKKGEKRAKEEKNKLKTKIEKHNFKRREKETGYIQTLSKNI